MHPMWFRFPNSHEPKVLHPLYNSVAGGLFGVQKLQAKVKDCFYWLGWFGDVKHWCVDCGSEKRAAQQFCTLLQSTAASRPHACVALNILGPLPETLGEKKKFKYIIGNIIIFRNRLLLDKNRWLNSGFVSY